ncbi:MAG: hypothetical protein HY433_01315 [Candidatus Liptonbacteria bacterium]|nr:hypothetical protein [Candidatus Liptonbacteria bacterium]
MCIVLTENRRFDGGVYLCRRTALATTLTRREGQVRIWEMFPDLFAAVHKSHEEVGLVGHHDWVHAARVGQIAYQIGLNETDKQTAELAGVAGLCHNADKVIQKKLGVGRREVPTDETSRLVKSWLMTETRPSAYGHVPEPVFGYYGPEVDAIVAAVLGHDGKNSSNDSPVLIALMDADRIVNLDGDLFARSGQHYADLPVVDYKHFLDDPEATYQAPRTVFRDIAYSLDWVDSESGVCIRTQLGKLLAAKRAAIFRLVTDGLRDQLEEEGIIPYPFGD